MARMSHELSDGLRDLARDMAVFSPGGLVLDTENLNRLVAMVRKYRNLALSLENEVSASRWNNRGRLQVAGFDDPAAVIAAVETPGSNVRLFPMLSRPFSDGRP